LEAFWTGKQSDYFTLYRYTAKATKAIDAEIKAGGPASAANAWIGDFVAFRSKNEIPADFIGTHHYPTDARIDQDHANAKRTWQDMGEPEYLNAPALTELHVASRLKDQRQAWRYQGGSLELDITMPLLGSPPLLCNLRGDHG